MPKKVGSDIAGSTEPESNHQVCGNGRRLKHRALLFFRPSPKPRPHHNDYACKCCRPSKHAVQNSHTTVCSSTSRVKLRQSGTQKAVEAEDDKEHTRSDAERNRGSPPEQANPERYANCAAQHKWQQTTVVI